jgi:ABC-type sulfate transport system permease component
MSLKLLFQRLELSFWDVFIPLMHKSPPVRFIVPRVYRLIHSPEFRQTVKLSLAIAFFGLILGFIFGVLSQL